jgi:hypothetical protein
MGWVFSNLLKQPAGGAVGTRRCADQNTGVKRDDHDVRCRACSQAVGAFLACGGILEHTGRLAVQPLIVRKATAEQAFNRKTNPSLYAT